MGETNCGGNWILFWWVGPYSVNLHLICFSKLSFLKTNKKNQNKQTKKNNFLFWDIGWVTKSYHVAEERGSITDTKPPAWRHWEWWSSSSLQLALILAKSSVMQFFWWRNWSNLCLMAADMGGNTMRGSSGLFLVPRGCRAECLWQGRWGLVGRAGRGGRLNINNLRYADDTTLMAQSKKN